MVSLRDKPGRRTGSSSTFFLEPWQTWRYLGIPILILLALFGITSFERPVAIANGGIHLRLAMDGVHSEYVRVGPYRVHYYVGGHGTPLLLIHGLGARSEDWESAIPIFVRSHFRVYAIDLLGYGRTDHPDIEYSIQQQVDMVHQFLAVMHIQQADVAGWSLGGWVALKLTSDYPEVVHRLVLYDSAGIVFHASFGPKVFTPQNKAQLLRLYRLLTPHPMKVPGFVARDILRIMRKNYWVVDRTIQSALTGKDSMDGKLNTIHVPVLVVWGKDDALIPPETGREMHQQMPQSVLELYAGCGHIGPASCAHRMIPNTVKFLQREPPMTGGSYNY